MGVLSDKLRGANEGEDMSEETVNSAVIAATIIAEISHVCTPIETYARVMTLQQVYGGICMVGGFLCVCGGGGARERERADEEEGWLGKERGKYGSGGLYCGGGDHERGDHERGDG